RQRWFALFLQQVPGPAESPESLVSQQHLRRPQSRPNDERQPHRDHTEVVAQERGATHRIEDGHRHDRQDDGARHELDDIGPHCSTPVVLRFGTYPTGILATSFSDLTSTTETSFVTGFATYAVLPSGVSVTQPAPMPPSSAPPSSFRSGSE